MRLAALLLALALPGCAGSFEEARGPHVRMGVSPELVARCQTLDDRKTFWGGGAKFGAALSGASGLAAIPVENKDARLALALSSATMAGVAVAAGYVSDSASTSWARECSK